MEEQEDYEFGYYAACLIDVLGQQRALAQWDDIGTLANQPGKLIPALKRTVGAILPLRQMALNFIKGAGEHRLERFAPEHQEEAAKYMRLEMKTQFFGDTIILYARPHIVNGYPTLNEVYSMIGGAASTLLSCLAGGMAVRGAINIGGGTELGPGDLYGPVLASAHHLESKCAGHPRIVVAPKVVGLLKDMASNTDGDRRIQFGREIANDCLRMLRKDDGYWEVDYLGSWVARIARRHQPNPFESALRFVVSQLDASTRAGNTVLAKRYGTVHAYFLRSRGNWQ